MAETEQELMEQETPSSPDSVPEFQQSDRAKTYSRNSRVAELPSERDDPEANEVSSFKDYSQR